jgi:hypothetical protein
LLEKFLSTTSFIVRMCLAGHHFFVVGLAGVEVDGGGVDVFVAEQALDHEDGAVFGAVGGEELL